VLPFLTYGSRPVIDVFVSAFEPHVDPAELDASPPPEEPSEAGEASASERRALMCDAFAAALAAAGDGRVGRRLRDACRGAGLTARLVQYVAALTQIDADDNGAFHAALARPGVPRALAALAGLAQRHAATQRDVMAADGLLALLHRVEGAATKSGAVGALAENLLDALATGDRDAAAAVADIRAASRREKKRMAARHRRAMLKKMVRRLLLGHSLAISQD
jgi:uncharacterized protein YdbL (DUF1318 family)